MACCKIANFFNNYSAFKSSIHSNLLKWRFNSKLNNLCSCCLIARKF